MNVAEWIRRNCRWYNDKVAYVDGDRSFTFAQFGDRVGRQVAALFAMGVGKGDRVAVLLNNGVEAVEAFAAAAQGGFVHVPINPRFSQSEIEYILGDSGACVLIADKDCLQNLDVAALSPLIPIVEVDPASLDSHYERWIGQQVTCEDVSDITGDDDLLIVYTSGTTGNPKGALFQHRQSVYHAPLSALCYDIRADSRLLLVYPHNSIASFNVCYVPAMAFGATVVLTDVRKFSAERWLSLVERHRITHCQLVPTMLFRILEFPALQRFDFSSLKTLGYASAPMPRERIERLSKTFGNILVQAYGMTEIASVATCLSKEDHAQARTQGSSWLESCGRPVYACDVRIVDEEGQEVAPGEAGEIIFRSPQMMKEYWHAPERTADAIRNGWLHSGDIGRFDDDGYLYLVDRKKDLIISGGANIASREVEEVLYWHSAIREAAVVGRPDEEWGERVHAFVSLHAGVVASEQEIIEFCQVRLARYKCPDRIEIIDDLPKNALGKFLKNVLRETFLKKNPFISSEKESI